MQTRGDKSKFDICLRFWQGQEGVAGAQDIFPLLDKYIADETLLITDGARLYLEYFSDFPQRKLELFQVCHKKGEFSRKEIHTDLTGNF